MDNQMNQSVADKFSKAFLKIADDIHEKYGDYWDYDYNEILCYEDDTVFDSLVPDDYSCYFEDTRIEDSLLYELIGTVGEGFTVCRYTSLQGLFRILHNKEQGLCCLVGMNDKSETNYADAYLGLLDYKQQYDSDIENRFFILSLLPEEKKDDLTMWRLYGQDATGVCIVFEEDIDKLVDYDDRITLLNINYGIDKNHHPALDFIKELLKVEIEGKKFRLRRLNEWKHFFKSYEYKDENEVRLLYKADDKETGINWILTSDYNIITPIKTFPLNDFPLKIKRIILGPNCPNKETNKIQIEQMIKSTNIPVLKSGNNDIVQFSNCISYR